VLKAKFRLESSACEPLFDAIGRWHVNAGFVSRAKGLLTSQESAKVAGILQLPPHPQTAK
jgi:hypothetical protein